jgi:YkoY family integral membrane protein
MPDFVPIFAHYDFFGQHFDWHDIATVALLIVLEGVLSIDNALVLGLLAKRLPKNEQKRALTYGLVGAFVFRVIAIATAALLLQMKWVKLLGGGYLVYIAVRHLFFESKEKHEEQIVTGETGEVQLVDPRTGGPLSPEAEELEIKERVPVYMDTATRKRLGLAAFWPTVLVIELTDIAFAVDSILAAIALVSGSEHHVDTSSSFHPKLWVVVTGGMLGVILMRFAAVIFIKLLEAFPRFEVAAYVLVALIGGKLLADWVVNDWLYRGKHLLDFHNTSSPSFWVFWVLMALAFLIGFIPRKKTSEAEE